MEDKVGNNDQYMNDEAKANFLKEAASYLESRICLVDNKAGVLMAIQGGFAGLVSWAIKEFLWASATPAIKFRICCFLVGILLLATVAIFLLIQTIRPSKLFRPMRIPHPKMEVHGYIMWPEGGSDFTTDQYKDVLQSLTWGKVRENYEKIHFTLFQLARRKYKFYRLAILFVELTVLCGSLGLVILVWLK